MRKISAWVVLTGVWGCAAALPSPAAAAQTLNGDQTDPKFSSPSVEVRAKHHYGETTTTLECTVQDSVRRPIPGAAIRFMRKDINWSSPRTATSDANGRFLIAGLPPGLYEVAITAEGYEQLLDSIVVRTGGFYVDFSLRRISEALAGAEVMLAGNRAFRQALELIDGKKYTESLPLLEEALASMKAAPAGSEGQAPATAEESIHHIEHVYAVALFESGKQDESRKNERWAQAQPLLEAALSRQPEDPRALKALLAIAKYRNDAGAVKKYGLIIEKLEYPDPVEDYNRALISYKTGRYTDAKTSLTEAIGKAPRFPESYYLLGMIESRLGNRGGASEAFTKYVDLAPDGEHVKRAAAFLEILQRKNVSGRKSRKSVPRSTGGAP